MPKRPPPPSNGKGVGRTVFWGVKSKNATANVKVEDCGIALMLKLEYFQNMHIILLMELEGLKVDEQLAMKAKDSAVQNKRLALLMVESYKANLASYCISTDVVPSTCKTRKSGKSSQISSRTKGGRPLARKQRRWRRTTMPPTTRYLWS